MHQYWYMNSKGSGQLYNNQISIPALYSQPQTPKLEGTGLGIFEGWSGRVYPTAWKSLGGLQGYDRLEQAGNVASPAGQMGLTAQEPSSGWRTSTDHEGSSPYVHNWNLLQPVNWPQLPEQPDFAPQGWAPSADHTGFNIKKQPASWAQPTNYAGMFAQGHAASWAPSAGHEGFSSQKKPLPWVQPVNHAGMFAQGHLAPLLPPSVNPFGFSASGQQANWGGFGGPSGWGDPLRPMGWWNNEGKGQPGILGGLLKVGKGTMNGIGIISSLIGVGKFLF